MNLSKVKWIEEKLSEAKFSAEKFSKGHWNSVKLRKKAYENNTVQQSELDGMKEKRCDIKDLKRHQGELS